MSHSELTQLRGPALFPDDPDFDKAVAIWDARHSQRPSVIAQCVSAGDVRKALRYASKHRLQVSVRSGGHNPNGYAVNDGGIVLDMRGMNSVVVDVNARTARVGGGALAGDLAREASEFGLAAVTGMLPGIGFSGIALNGGVGYFTAQHGLVCDNLLAATLVTAGGELVYCSADQRPELFWGIRGAGSNFGVATELEVALHDLPRSVLGGVITWEPTHAEFAGVLGEVLATVHRSSSGLYPAVVVNRSHTGGIELMAVICHVGPPETADREIAAVRAVAPAHTDTVRRAEYFDAVVAIDEEIDKNFKDGLSRVWADREMALPAANFAVIVAEHVDRLVNDPSADAVMTLTIEGKPIPNRYGTPAWHRKAPGVSVKVGFRGSENAARFTHLVADLDTTLVRAKAATAHHGNLHSISDVTDSMIKASFGDRNYDRLSRLKAEYDPDNVFRLNYNVPPATH